MMISAKKLGLTYPDGTVAVHPFDLEVKPGELIYITGPSGSGKTSFMKMLIGRETPTEGQLTVLDTQILKTNHKKVQEMRHRLGPVFQEFRLIQGKTAMENVIMGMRFLDLPISQMKADSEAALIRVGLEHKLRAKVDHLSYGECQRVAIARAVARKPVLILADEPTGNLDHANAVNILQLLSSFRDDKTAVILTTHATHLIEDDEIATYITMNQGQLSIKKMGARA